MVIQLCLSLSLVLHSFFFFFCLITSSIFSVVYNFALSPPFNLLYRLLSFSLPPLTFSPPPFFSSSCFLLSLYYYLFTITFLLSSISYTFLVHSFSFLSSTITSHILFSVIIHSIHLITFSFIIYVCSLSSSLRMLALLVVEGLL